MYLFCLHTAISEDIDGPFHKRHDDEYWRNKPIEELPLSRKVKRLEAEVNKWEHDGNPLLFLKDEKPDIYAQDFKENYYARSGAEDELRDGAVAVRLAFKNFFNNLNGQEWTKLGLSIFFFSLSLITSVAACFLTVFYAEREDTKMSHSNAVEKTVEDWLEDIRRTNYKLTK